MDFCEHMNHQFISFYLYENGMPCKPERIGVRRSEIQKTFETRGTKFYYHGKDSNGKFICLDYSADYDALMKKRSELKKKVEFGEKSRFSKSAPAIPSSCNYSKCASKRLNSCENEDHDVKPPHRCCDQNSDESEEEDCNKKLPRPRSKKCVKKPKSRPTCESEGSLPQSGSRYGPRCGGGNTKMTQTTREDLEKAKKCYQRAIKEEKKLRKMYGKTKASKAKLKCDEAKKLQKYYKKRQKMEKKINKTLEKKAKNKKKC